MLGWFAMHGRRFPWRRRRSTVYGTMVAELLLQRTTATAVAEFLPSFLARYPSWKALDAADVDKIEADLRPIGLWMRRASSLKRLAEVMVRLGGRFPKERSELEELPGVGQYFASAVLLFVHRKPAPLLDTNMARVLERFFGSRQLADIRYDPYLQQLAQTVVDCQQAVNVNRAILDLAAEVCRPTIPRCPDCPVRKHCLYPGARNLGEPL